MKKIRINREQGYFLFLFAIIFGIAFSAPLMTRVLSINYALILYSLPISLIIHKILQDTGISNKRKGALVLFHLLLIIGAFEFNGYIEKQKFLICFDAFREYCTFYKK